MTARPCLLPGNRRPLVMTMTRHGALTILATALCLLVASACGTTAQPTLSSVDGQSSPTARATPIPVSLVPLPSPEGTPSEYTTSVFRPVFTVTIPAGWTVAERAADVVQIYQRCDACPHGGEEHGEITFDMSSAAASVEDSMADLQAAVGMDPSPIVSAEVGTLVGQSFVATRGETTDVAFATSGYHSEPFGLPIGVYALELGDQTATVFVDPHQAMGDEGEAFMAAAADILATLRAVE